LAALRGQIDHDMQPEQCGRSPVGKWTVCALGPWPLDQEPLGRTSSLLLWGDEGRRNRLVTGPAAFVHRRRLFSAKFRENANQCHLLAAK
jgi:hypothetical protein